MVVDLLGLSAGGDTAASAWFVLTYLPGREQVRVYDGSWAEWGKLPAAPVECAHPQRAVPG